MWNLRISISQIFLMNRELEHEVLTHIQPAVGDSVYIKLIYRAIRI